MSEPYRLYTAFFGTQGELRVSSAIVYDEQPTCYLGNFLGAKTQLPREEWGMASSQLSKTGRFAARVSKSPQNAVLILLARYAAKVIQYERAILGLHEKMEVIHKFIKDQEDAKDRADDNTVNDESSSGVAEEKDDG